MCYPVRTRRTVVSNFIKPEFGHAKPNLMAFAMTHNLHCQVGSHLRAFKPILVVLQFLAHSQHTPIGMVSYFDKTMPTLLWYAWYWSQLDSPTMLQKFSDNFLNSDSVEPPESSVHIRPI